MTLIEQIDATQFLTMGWDGDKAKPVNDATRRLAKSLTHALGDCWPWKASPWPDGSIVFTADNKKIMVAAQCEEPPIIATYKQGPPVASEYHPPDSGGAFVSTVSNCCSSMMAGSL